MTVLLLSVLGLLGILLTGRAVIHWRADRDLLRRRLGA
jgi:hypothetical protein